MNDPRVEKKKLIRYFNRYLDIIPTVHQSSDVYKPGLIYYSLSGLSILYDNDGDYKNFVQEFKKNGSSTTIKSLFKIFDNKNDQNAIAGFIPTLTVLDTKPSNLNLSATFFSLLSLCILQEIDFLKDSDKYKIKNFVSKCQDLENTGGFVSYLDILGNPNNRLSGSQVDSIDLRFCYIAVSILYICGCKTILDYKKWIDTDKLLNFIFMDCYCKNTGGFGNGVEPHAGYTSCALGTLKLLGVKLPTTEMKNDTLSWLVHRQLTILANDSELKTDSEWYDSIDCGGFQGRENKFADTCYCFWCLNSLELLGDEMEKGSFMSLVDLKAVESYLLDVTQNKLLGGFAKNNANDPDLYHSFLGLAALALISGKFDSVLCVPKVCLK
ncbi:related to Geranylgeranyl transferase type-1 subunit beta [Saccharomycodes ludwigii]|uniref:Related to Geranylgeranyl transferase type-1 subunit beta n=1 Tax=Saccharomycodes ludwigii TaxID=36035 RepID=A0A376B6P5_9ASCO|nr:hypothetical protein SCDLUD_002726 [Saccharomycodes ludwigii]KAH3901238.1 hypothetical protein SCDLUD_002726 [Saccharomycodes ludwigii]SSD60348.1 related to Geranylgeranyl transferase type-1 subunit beta [Saccharomycodes ludwigii]